MTVIVDEKAKRYLTEHGETSLYTFLGGCRSWGGVVLQPAVYAGAPRHPDEYTNSETDGITVYVHQDVKAADDTLTITTKKMLWSESLNVKGMAY